VTLARITLDRSGVHDLPFIMGAERMPGFESLVGRWDEDRHMHALENPRYAYFLIKQADEAIGFAILRDWKWMDKVTQLKRMVISKPGNGHGKAALQRLNEIVFSETDAYRFWLGVFPGNARARRAYEAVGFRAEGIARGSAYVDGQHRDELVMAILRPEWEANPFSR
jgi:RimJ/RimL family protein N-acetyltransferase